MDQNYNPYGNPQNNTDHNSYAYRPYPNPSYGNRQSPNPMETLSLILGVLSVVTCSCCYLSLPMGAVAIVLALLSRGGQMKLSSKAKLAIAVGIMGLALTIGMYTLCFYVTFTNLEMFEEMMRQYCDNMGLDFETLYGDMFQYLKSMN